MFFAGKTSYKLQENRQNTIDLHSNVHMDH